MDKASSSDARGPGLEPQPLHFKKYHFFTLKPKGSPRSRAHPQISELSVRGRDQAEKSMVFKKVPSTIYIELKVLVNWTKTAPTSKTQVIHQLTLTQLLLNTPSKNALMVRPLSMKIFPKRWIELQAENF